MGIKQNYLYRVMPGLAEEGKGHPGQSGREVAPTKPVLAQPHGVALPLELVRPSVDPLARESGTSSPSTISHSPSAVRQGKEEMIPSSTP